MKKTLALLLASALIIGQTSQIALASGEKTSPKTQAVSEKQAVENDIVRMQKDFTSWARKTFDILSKEGMKKSGDMNFALNSKSDDSESKFQISISDYESKSDFFSNSGEMKATINASVYMSGSKYDYTKKKEATGSGKTNSADLSYADYMESMYEKVPVQLDAKAGFKATVVVDRKYVYFTITKPEVTVTGTEKEVKEFNETIDEMNEYTGKTFKIALNDNSEISIASMNSRMNAVFNVLEKSSLFESRRKVDENTHQLGFKRSTLQAINVALGRNKNADISSFRLNKETLTYKKVAGKTEILFTPNSAKTDSAKSKNYILLENTGSDYVLSGKAEQRVNTKYDKRTETMSFRASYNSLEFKNTTKTQWSNATTSLTWNGDAFKLTSVTTSKYSAKNTMIVEGSLNLDSKKVDLTLKNNGKSLGQLIVTPIESGYTYSVTSNFDILGQVIDFTLNGTEKHEYGKQVITVPTDAELIEEDSINF